MADPTTRSAAELLSFFVGATQKVFQIQLNSPLTMLKASAEAQDSSQWNIAGLVSFHTTLFNGKVLVCFQEPVFLNMYAKLLGEVKPEKINAEVAEAAAEMMNIIYGQAKLDLNQRGHAFDRVFPSILLGEQIQAAIVDMSPIVTVPFQSDLGIFHLRIGYETNTLKKVA